MTEGNSIMWLNQDKKMIHTILSFNYFVNNEVKRMCDSILDEIKPT